MKKLTNLVKTKFNAEARLDCKQQVDKCARKAIDQDKRQFEWQAKLGNSEFAFIGMALEDDFMKTYKKRLRREGCFGKCNSLGGMLLGKGNPDKCALMDSDILN